jgi:hypothetical protein
MELFSPTSTVIKNIKIPIRLSRINFPMLAPLFAVVFTSNTS